MNIVGASNRTDTEEEIIRRHKTDVLYNHEFEKGRFFQVVHEDSDGFTVKLAPRTMLKAVYIKENDDIEGIEIIKLIDEKEKQKVVLSKFNFAQLRAFLTFISEIDLKGITEKRIKLIQEDELDAETIRKVNTLLSKEGGEDVVINLINSGIITSKDIVNTSFRKRGLKIFKSMISMEAYWKTYASDNSIISLKEESVWQYFFKRTSGFSDMVWITDIFKFLKKKHIYPTVTLMGKMKLSRISYWVIKNLQLLSRLKNQLRHFLVIG